MNTTFINYTFSFCTNNLFVLNGTPFMSFFHHVVNFFALSKIRRVIIPKFFLSCVFIVMLNMNTYWLTMVSSFIFNKYLGYPIYTQVFGFR